MSVISRYPSKVDGSGLCKKKEWGFCKNGHAFWGYTSRKQAVKAKNDADRLTVNTK